MAPRPRGPTASAACLACLLNGAGLASNRWCLVWRSTAPRSSRSSMAGVFFAGVAFFPLSIYRSIARSHRSGQSTCNWCTSICCLPWPFPGLSGSSSALPPYPAPASVPRASGPDRSRRGTPTRCRNSGVLDMLPRPMGAVFLIACAPWALRSAYLACACLLVRCGPR